MAHTLALASPPERADGGRPRRVGPIAAPDVIQFAPALPKTRSGKIMRRILRKIAENATGEIGDTTTLADPHVVESLVAEHDRLVKK